MLHYRHEMRALYVYDHNGKNPQSAQSTCCRTRRVREDHRACMITVEDNANLMSSWPTRQASSAGDA